MNFLLILGVASLIWIWAASNRYPKIRENADALTLLNFPPFLVQAGKQTYAYFMTPEGLTEAQMRDSIAKTMKLDYPGTKLSLHRRHIPLPGPTSILPLAGQTLVSAGQVPAFADLWAVASYYTGRTGTISPDVALQMLGVPEPASHVDPARQLAGILYAAALAPNATKALAPAPAILIAAKQWAYASGTRRFMNPLGQPAFGGSSPFQ